MIRNHYMDVGVSDLKKIVEVIKEKYNYDFSNYAMSSFKRRIGRILELRKLTPQDLIERIKNNGFNKEEFLNEVTVNVTEMFRDPSFWKALKVILTDTLKAKGRAKIWHAGCSSGEEVFSMMILLHEINSTDKVEIIASDIDKSILNKAIEGKIGKKNMELNTNNYLRYNNSGTFNNYFTEEGEFFRFKKSLMKPVIFKEVDLVRASSFDKFDFILCRNVLIYFNQTLQNEVLKLFCNSLNNGGYLATGSKESIIYSDVSKNFQAVNLEEKIYKKVKDNISLI